MLVFGNMCADIDCLVKSALWAEHPYRAMVVYINRNFIRRLSLWEGYNFTVYILAYIVDISIVIDEKKGIIL